MRSIPNIFAGLARIPAGGPDVKQPSSILFLTLTAFLGTAPPPAQAQIPEGWEIRKISDTNDRYQLFVDINDRGQVVWVRGPGNDANKLEIVVCDRGRVIPITVDDVQDWFPRINNKSEVAWERLIEPLPVYRTGIVFWRAGHMQFISDPPVGYYDTGVDINDAGQLVWARQERGATRSPAYFYDGATAHQLTNDQFTWGVPRINNNGDFVFVKLDYSRLPHTSEIIGWFDGQRTNLSGEQDQGLSGPGLNDKGHVVWGTPSDIIVKWINGSIESVITKGRFFAPTINDRGDIAAMEWDAVRRKYKISLLRSGVLWQLTDATELAESPEINTRGEVVYSIGAATAAARIELFTRPEFAVDLDMEGDVDLRDIAAFQRCFGQTDLDWFDHCSIADVDADGSVDLDDYLAVHRFLYGPE